MIISKAQLITAIHEVEEGNHSRISSLITECYLMRQFKMSLAQGKYSDVQSGWVIQRDTTLLDSEEIWYKIISESAPISAVDWEVVSEFSQDGRSFFSVGYSFEPDLPLPECIKLTAQKLHHGYAPRHTVCRDQSNVLTQNLQSFILTLGKRADNQPEPFKPWLTTLDQCELELMLVQRCLMNSIDMCVDIDAVALKTVDNQLVLFEFKRKYPTQGGNPLNHAFKKSFDNLNQVTSNLTRDMANLYRLIKKENYKSRSKKLREQFNLLCTNNNAGVYQKNTETRYCGLDRDHVHNVHMCEIANV